MSGKTEKRLRAENLLLREALEAKQREVAAHAALSSDATFRVAWMAGLAGAAEKSLRRLRLRYVAEFLRLIRCFGGPT